MLTNKNDNNKMGSTRQFSLGDKVWVMHDNEPQECVIAEIEFSVTNKYGCTFLRKMAKCHLTKKELLESFLTEEEKKQGNDSGAQETDKYPKP